MTRTFERFLRSFSDEDLVAFAQDRSRVRPPYWKVLRVALAIEASRRGLQLGDALDTRVTRAGVPSSRMGTG